MKKINEMSVKELRKVAKELNIAGRWDMTKAQLVEAIKKIENEKRLQSKLRRNPTKKKAMRVQRAFIEVGDTRKEVYRYITITVKNVEESKAADYIDAVCAKMQEMDEEFEAEYNVLRCPDYDEATKSYTDMISFTKVAGKIAAQRQYIGKLMTKAMTALK